jgi:hypothetical protein
MKKFFLFSIIFLFYTEQLSASFLKCTSALTTYKRGNEDYSVMPTCVCYATDNGIFFSDAPCINNRLNGAMAQARLRANANRPVGKRTGFILDKAPEKFGAVLLGLDRIEIDREEHVKEMFYSNFKVYPSSEIAFFDEKANTLLIKRASDQKLYFQKVFKIIAQDLYSKNQTCFYSVHDEAELRAFIEIGGVQLVRDCGVNLVVDLVDKNANPVNLFRKFIDFGIDIFVDMDGSINLDLMSQWITKWDLRRFIDNDLVPGLKKFEEAAIKSHKPDWVHCILKAICSEAVKSAQDIEEAVGLKNSAEKHAFKTSTITKFKSDVTSYLNDVENILQTLPEPVKNPKPNNNFTIPKHQRPAFFSKLNWYGLKSLKNHYAKVLFFIAILPLLRLLGSAVSPLAWDIAKVIISPYMEMIPTFNN